MRRPACVLRVLGLALAGAYLMPDSEHSCAAQWVLPVESLAVPPCIKAARFPQEKIFQDELPFAAKGGPLQTRHAISRSTVSGPA